MDAGNSIGPVGVASLVPALEKMRLTHLNLSSAQIGSSEPGARGGFAFSVAVGCFLGVRLDGV